MRRRRTRKRNHKKEMLPHKNDEGRLLPASLIAESWKGITYFYLTAKQYTYIEKDVFIVQLIMTYLCACASSFYCIRFANREYDRFLEPWIPSVSNALPASRLFPQNQLQRRTSYQCSSCSAPTTSRGHSHYFSATHQCIAGSTPAGRDRNRTPNSERRSLSVCRSPSVRHSPSADCSNSLVHHNRAANGGQTTNGRQTANSEQTANSKRRSLFGVRFRSLPVNYLQLARAT